MLCFCVAWFKLANLCFVVAGSCTPSPTGSYRSKSGSRSPSPTEMMGDNPPKDSPTPDRDSLHIDMVASNQEAYGRGRIKNKKKIFGICIVPTQPFRAALGTESRVCYPSNTSGNHKALMYSISSSQQQMRTISLFTFTAGIRTYRKPGTQQVYRSWIACSTLDVFCTCTYDCFWSWWDIFHQYGVQIVEQSVHSKHFDMWLK
jgi:hypothetical protein